MQFSPAHVLLLVDPTSRERGGIATYCNLARKLLERSGLSVVSVKRCAGEDVHAFRARIGSLVAKYGLNLLQVEAPETYAATLDLPAHVNVHVRLHCARSLGALWEGLPLDEQTLRDERAVIAKARVISCPTYAAWRETNRLAEVRSAHMFANPPPTYHGGDMGARSGVVLIGRAQTLKGIQYLPGLLKHLSKSIPVILAGPGMKAAVSHMRIANRVEALDEIDETRVRTLLSTAGSCLVASPFETFSMVAAEALAANTPVVTWAHSGTAELASAPFVRTVPAWDLAALARAIEESIAFRLPSSAQVITELENQFVAGHFALRSGMRPTAEYPQFKELFPIPTPPTQSTAMTFQATSTPLQRKIRKLLRDPRRFFADAKVIKKVAPPLARKLNTRSSVPVTVRALPRAHSLGAAFAGINYGVAVHALANAQGVVLNDLAGPDPRTRSLFLLDQGAADSEVGLLREMQRIGTKFSLLSPNHVALGTFIDDKVTTFKELLAGIDPAERGKLGAVQNIISTASSLNFGRALRACHSGSRLFHIVRPGDPQLSVPAEDIDVLIAPIGYAIAPLKLRRVMRYPSVGADNVGIAGAVLRACQEAAPKPLDVLLPALGNCQYDPALLDVDTKFVQGVLLCNEPIAFVSENAPLGKPVSFDEQMAELGDRLEGVLLCESVLWRYRTAIDTVKGPDDWVAIIKLAAYDGIRFDMKYIDRVNQHVELHA